jgi:hypothetical protein
MAGLKVSNHQVIPSARRLIKSLRNMGYDFSSAVADLIDNSISANATEINISVEFDGDHSKVRIADNGSGMSENQLKEAMRYGSDRDYEEDNALGKFGLGLKTASLSQCQKLSVVTREEVHKEFYAYCWDLEHIDKTDQWELIIPDKKQVEKILKGHLSKNGGTVVVWESLDRMLGQKHPYGEASRKRLWRMCRELEDHLAMVFHRFLSGEVPGKKINIILNDNLLIPWDPFVRNEKKTRQLDTCVLYLSREDVSGNVTLRPYILPHQDDFSSMEVFNRASGPKKWNQQQGFYIYRASRLIQSGGWCNVRAADEHTKLARISLDFSPELDDAFSINVAKMRVLIPQEVRDEIEEIASNVAKQARIVYDKKDKPKQTDKPGKASSLKKVSDKGVEWGSPHEIHTELENQKWTIDELQRKLLENAFADEAPVIVKVFKRLRRKLTS